VIAGVCLQTAYCGWEQQQYANNLQEQIQNARQVVEALQTEKLKNMPPTDKVQKLLVRIALVANDEENKLTVEQEFSAIDEVRTWFAARPDTTVEYSVSDELLSFLVFIPRAVLWLLMLFILVDLECWSHYIPTLSI
jgi:hypothetical protein